MQDESAVTAIVPAQESIGLGLMNANSPRALMEVAADMATHLAKLINERQLYTMLRGKPYVVVEGWTTLGTMLGVIAREVETTEQNGIFVSIVELVRISDGAVISRASAECGADDEKDRHGKPIWAARPRYARRSMAQTRATGKACRLAFSWIMKLAGYEPTPAEEMQFAAEESEPRPKPQPKPQPKPEPAPVEPRPQDIPPGETISEPQRVRLEAQINELRLDRERVKELCCKWFGKYHFAELGKNQYTYLDKFLPRLAAKAEAERKNPTLRLDAIQTGLEAHLIGFEEPPEGNAEAITTKAWSAAGERHGEWPTEDFVDHGTFFCLVQEEINGRVPCACRDCDALNPSIWAALADGWKRDSPPSPGPVSFVCPDCQKSGKAEAGS